MGLVVPVKITIVGMLSAVAACAIPPSGRMASVTPVSPNEKSLKFLNGIMWVFLRGREWVLCMMV